ncbi:hypothetical protein [Lacinutrix chionoecetis]
MKKIFTFCFFAFALLIGTQSAVAQDKVEINEKASNTAKALKQQLKFDDNTLEQVYLAYQGYENKMYSIDTNLESGTQYYKDAVTKTDAVLQERMKELLGNDMYARYLIIVEQDGLENTANKSTAVKRVR